MRIDELLLVRHGESLGNLAAAEAYQTGAEVIRLDTRDADVPLSPLGLSQAEALGGALAARLGDGVATMVWSSPYVRALQTTTAALAAAGIGADIRLDERLRDRELGVLDLLTRAGVAARYPAEAERRRWLGKFYHRPPGGESWADVALRLRSFLRDLDAATSAPRALVVTHDAVILLLRYLCEGLSESEVLGIGIADPVRNTALTSLRRDAGGWRLVDYNDVRHLQGTGTPVTEHRGEA